MRPIATDAARSRVCVSVCLCVVNLSHWCTVQKTAEPIQMPFRALTHVAPKNYVLDGKSVRENVTEHVRRWCQSATTPSTKWGRAYGQPQQPRTSGAARQIVDARGDGEEEERW